MRLLVGRALSCVINVAQARRTQACPVLAMADSCRHPRASSLGACMCRRCFNPTASLSTFGSRAAGRRRWLRPTHRPSGACSQKLAGFGKHDHGTPSQVSGYLGLSESDLSSVICLLLVFLPICRHEERFSSHASQGRSVRGRKQFLKALAPASGCTSNIGRAEVLDVAALNLDYLPICGKSNVFDVAALVFIFLVILHSGKAKPGS